MRTKGNSKMIRCESEKRGVRRYGVSRATWSSWFVWNLLGWKKLEEIRSGKWPGAMGKPG